MTTATTGRPVNARSPPQSCRAAWSPINTAVGFPEAAAMPPAVARLPSMPDTPRLPCRVMALSLVPPKASMARIASELPTKQWLPSGKFSMSRRATVPSKNAAGGRASASARRQCASHAAGADARGSASSASTTASGAARTSVPLRQSGSGQRVGGATRMCSLSVSPASQRSSVRETGKRPKRNTHAGCLPAGKSAPRRKRACRTRKWERSCGPQRRLASGSASTGTPRLAAKAAMARAKPGAAGCSPQTIAPRRPESRLASAAASVKPVAAGSMRIAAGSGGGAARASGSNGSRKGRLACTGPGSGVTHSSSKRAARARRYALSTPPSGVGRAW